MAEFFTVAGIAAGVVCAVAGGISLGSRYVYAKLHYDEQKINLDRPIVASQFRRERVQGEQRAV